jgi:hypothetical protein
MDSQTRVGFLAVLVAWLLAPFVVAFWLFGAGLCAWAWRFLVGG